MKTTTIDALEDIDLAEFRRALSCFATGVAVVTTLDANGDKVGMTISSFNSVSLDPPLIVWSIDLQSPSLGAFRRHSFFAINILCDQSKELALNFARPSHDKFANVDWKPGLGGVPVIEQASAVIQCRTEARMPGGDHEIYLGHVLDFHRTDKSPLLFHKGEFSTIGEKI